MDAIPSPRRSPRGTKRTADTVAADEAAAMRKKFGQEGARLHMTPIRYTGKGWPVAIYVVTYSNRRKPMSNSKVYVRDMVRKRANKINNIIYYMLDNN